MKMLQMSLMFFSLLLSQVSYAGCPTSGVNVTIPKGETVTIFQSYGHMHSAWFRVCNCGDYDESINSDGNGKKDPLVVRAGYYSSESMTNDRNVYGENCYDIIATGIDLINNNDSEDKKAVFVIVPTESNTLPTNQLYIDEVNAALKAISKH